MKVANKDLKYNISRWLYNLSLKIDNSGNCNFETNGEKKLLSLLLQELNSKKQITLFDVGGNVGDYTQLLFENVTNIQNFSIHV